jgi:hypothetical protein
MLITAQLMLDRNVNLHLFLEFIIAPGFRLITFHMISTVAKPIAMYMVLVTVLVIVTQRVGYKQIAIVELIAIVHITVIIITVTAHVIVIVTAHVHVFQLVQRY